MMQPYLGPASALVVLATSASTGDAPPTEVQFDEYDAVAAPLTDE
ncbi:hypothetical protein [Candidatus Rhodobacter oscarellae]|nr:hypothetical protein [Candidatus Rhodobacter lobularis]